MLDVNIFATELNYIDVKTSWLLISKQNKKPFIQTVISTETINGGTTFDPIHVFVVDLKVQ